MLVQKVFSRIAKWSVAPSEADYFREQSLIVVTGVLALAAWLWVGQCVFSQALSAAEGLLLMALVAGAAWLIYRLHQTHYVAAVVVFLTAETLFIALLAGLLRDLTLGYLFILTILTAGSLLGPFSALVLAGGVILAEVGLVNLTVATPWNGASQLTELAVLQLLTAIVSGLTAQGLYTAIEAAKVSARQANDHAKEAREHRGELHRTLKSLDHAYAQLQRANAELFQAREVADVALRFKREFVAQTSHELRTPLNLILGFSETMAFAQNSYGVKLPAPYLRDVTEIYRNSRHLLTLIDDILDLSKLDAGRMGLHCEPVNLSQVLQEAADTIRPLTQAKKLAFDLDLPAELPVLWIDQARIQQVLLNFLSNAARITQRGYILLRAHLTERELIVQVEDSGPGLPPEALQLVFEEFQQVGEGTGAPGTTGLGLTVSKRIVELHGGRIWAQSEVDAGSTFSFTLPLQKTTVLPTTSGAVQPGQLAEQPPVVVIGDEESDEVKLIQRHLEGFALLVAKDWGEAARFVADMRARAVIATEPFDPVQAPDDLPVPVLTCSLPGPRQTAEVLGVAAYLRKPVEMKTLQTALRETVPSAKSLLIVDDEPSMVRLLERMALAEEAEHQIFRAYTGQEAWARILAQPPEAVLLDLTMPEGDGYWLIDRIRQTPSTAHIPILAISGQMLDDKGPQRPIYLNSATGFSPTETLNYLQAILSATPPQSAPLKAVHYTSAPPSSTDHPA